MRFTRPDGDWRCEHVASNPPQELLRPGERPREHPEPAARNCEEEALIKLDIINEVVAKTGITKTKAEMAVETVFESMKRALSQGERIELRGFGIFNVRPRKTGIGRNPRTGAEVAIPPGKAVRFKPGKELQSLQ
jgi:DNA-binding protein HU-beta